MKSTSNGNPALISEWRDDEARSSSHVLETVAKSGLNLLDGDRVIFTRVLLIVETELLLPREVVDCVHIGRSECFYNITGVDILCDKSDENATLQLCKRRSPDNDGKLIQLL